VPLNDVNKFTLRTPSGVRISKQLNWYLKTHCAFTCVMIVFTAVTTCCWSPAGNALKFLEISAIADRSWGRIEIKPGSVWRSSCSQFINTLRAGMTRISCPKRTVSA